MRGIDEFISKVDFFRFSIPTVGFADVIDILIVALIIYKAISWIRNTRAWTLFKGIIAMGLIAFVAIFLQLTTVVWIFSKTISVGIIAAIILFQPELRKALEQLGTGKVFKIFLKFEEIAGMHREIISPKTIEEIVDAVSKMGTQKTGALIVIEQDVKLGEYENTGIKLNADISEQLLINIFEHNTPLHDGAILLRGNKVSSATCYLPLTDNLEISKELGTRHRAAIGITEISDAVVVVVSEETGAISFARSGKLTYDIKAELLKTILTNISQTKTIERSKIRLWKGKKKNA